MLFMRCVCKCWDSMHYTRDNGTCIVCTTNYTALTSHDSVQPAALFNCVGTYMSKPQAGTQHS